eukprot:3297320-Pyramimonas_sp.AAC.1
MGSHPTPQEWGGCPAHSDGAAQLHERTGEPAFAGLNSSIGDERPDGVLKPDGHLPLAQESAHPLQGDSFDGLVLATEDNSRAGRGPNFL